MVKKGKNLNRDFIVCVGLDELLQFAKDGLIPKYQAKRYGQPLRAAKEYKLFQRDVGFEDLEYLYQRVDIAANAVDTPARDVFSKGFEVKSYSEGEIENRQFEDAVWELNIRLNVKGVFWEAYRYCRLYGLGLIFLGLADSAPLEKEPENVRDIEYLLAISAPEIREIKFVNNPTSPKHGEIESYIIKVSTPSGEQDKPVHPKRVIHVMENTLKRNPWGISILQPAYNLFQILLNVDWSAGEAYYQNASPIFILSYPGRPSDAELEAAEADLKDISVRSRYIKPETWKLDTVTGSGRLPDPGMFWNPIIERIAGAVKIPKQILLGTAAGALASGEVNLAQYYKDIASIQSNLVTPLLREFYGRLQEWKLLPPAEYDIEWNPLWEMDEKEKAEIVKIKAETAATLKTNQLATVEEIRKLVLGLEPQIGGGVDAAKNEKTLEKT